MDRQRSFWSRHRRLKWLAFSCLLFLMALTVVTVLAARRAEPFLRALIIARLEEHFQARVELDSFHVSIARGLRAEGKGLRIWAPAGVAAGANSAGKPLIELAEFRFRAPLHYNRSKPIRIARIELRGLTIDVPPHAHFTHTSATLPPAATQPNGQPPTAPSQAATGPQAAAGPRSPAPPGAGLLRFQVDTVLCEGARLILETSNPAKLPLTFDIQTLKVLHVSSDGAMDFEATLTNPRPRGQIVTKGSFGPWAVAAPGMTPVQGSYSFDHADLGTFHGISGTLDSTGRYAGALDDMVVDGITDTPNFALSRFGTAMPLHTEFHATVDGTNGDTWLEPVNATLGHSHFVAQGEVVELPATAAASGEPAHSGGHEIALDVDVEHGEMADFLRLTSRHDNPLLTGTLHTKAALDIPPGSDPVHERLRLKGYFDLEDAQFTNPKIQDRVAGLSLRGQGKPEEVKNSAADASVHSTMKSSFTVANAVVTLPDLTYSVPGADINLHGTYDLDGGGLNFKGTATMEATVSQMVGGWKGAILKPMDRFFKKDGAGTKIGIHVEGTRQDPHFGIDF